MTETAIRNREIAAKKDIANRDRELEERKFKHKRVMDYLGAGAQAAGQIAKLFIPGGKAATAAKGAGALVSAAKANDPEWYKSYITDLDKWTNLTTWLRAGAEKYGGRLFGKEVISTVTGKTTSHIQMAPSGIAVINWVPALGNISNSLTDISESPINQILMRTKEEVLKSNSRSSVKYEAADLGLNFLTVGSIVVAICEFEKAILVAQTYKADNAYYAKHTLTAMGYDAEAIMDNLPDARKYLIQLKKRFNSAIVAPSGLNYYKKMIFLGTLWAKDSECNPAQIYTATCSYFWKLNEDGSGLNAELPVRSSPKAIYEQISSMMQVISENKDYVEMFSDLRSAFAGNLLQLETSFDEDATITENYNADAIEQIANICTLPSHVNGGDVYVTRPIAESVVVHQSDSGYLYQGVTPTAQGVQFWMNNEGLDDADAPRYFATLNMERAHVVNFHKDEISGDNVLDATRWHFKLAGVSIGDDGVRFRVASSDVAICSFIKLFTLNSSGAIEQHDVTTDVIIDRTTYDSQYALEMVSHASTFDWMPLVTTLRVDASGTDAKAYNLLTSGEIQHAVCYPVENLRHLNEVCVLSLMYIDSSQFKRSGK